ncbi:hypothetical protein I317_04792 [Kwoniella heveanensis CBS 569]|nr:hypothetical protein I317_04792 [Kwoniella heveanensis CBS 569]
MTLLLKLFTLLSILSYLTYAAPVVPEPLRRLPLRKIPTKRSNEHPVQAFERHQRAAIKRMHRFKKVDPPSESDFRERALEKRRQIEANPRLDKRLWLPFNPLPDVDNIGQAEPERRAWWRPTDATTASSPAATRSLPPPRVNAISGQGGGAQATATVQASGSSANGFSRVALQASQDLALTSSDAELIQGGLDYIIEGNDIGYLCEIQIGTPARTFLLLMDTGSADTWVPSTNCAAEQCGDHTALGTENSNTFLASQRQFQVTYGSGNVAGVLAADTMSIAGMTLKNHAMGVTLVESVQFSSARTPFDGLMGLALSKLSNQGVSTPLESLASTGLIKGPVLGIALGRVTDGENNGELVFGQANTAKLDSRTTQTLPVTSDDGFWQVEMLCVRVDGVEAVGSRQAILDTGTSLMIAPPADVGGGMFSIPCTLDQEVTMTFGNIAFQIDVRDLIFQPLSADLSGDCLSSLSAGVIKDDSTWLLGDSFLKNVYMSTNARDLTVELSARTDVPGSSSFGVVAGAGAGAALSADTGAGAGTGTGAGTGSEAGAGTAGVGMGATSTNGTTALSNNNNNSTKSKSASTPLTSAGANTAKFSLIGAVAALLAGGSSL